MMKSCAKWKMTKFDIFVVNLRRSVDRREAMREKIKRIRGFAKIYIDDEMVVDSTHPLAPSAREGESNLNAQGAESATFCHSKSFFCHSERSEESQKNHRDSSVATLPQNDKLKKVQNDNLSDFAESILHFHFFPATDATKFKNGESPLPPQYSSKLTRFVKGKDLSFGEMACFSSHYRLWQQCVELDSPIVVLEDDIDFMQYFCRIVDIFKSPFEYVRLYYLFDRKITHLYNNFYISFGNVSGAQGYYLTPQAAQKFIKNARFWLFCVDDYMDMFFIHSVKNIIFKPFIISEDSLSAGTSTILGREKPKMRFYQKLTRELSRIYFFVIRKYMYFALSFLQNLGVELRAFFRAHKVAH